VCQSGIDGIEVFYPQHDAEDTKRYMDMAQEYGLMVSGGSDFHGFPTRWPQELGLFTIEDKWAEKFYRPQRKL
jgi:predicted metal-dependent phosphoesterase TrpH